MQRKVFNVDNPPARGSATMNFISAPHRSHFRAGFSSVLAVPIMEHYARSARTWLQNVKVSHKVHCQTDITLEAEWIWHVSRRSRPARSRRLAPYDMTLLSLVGRTTRLRVKLSPPGHRLARQEHPSNGTRRLARVASGSGQEQTSEEQESGASSRVSGRLGNARLILGEPNFAGSGTFTYDETARVIIAGPGEAAAWPGFFRRHAGGDDGRDSLQSRRAGFHRRAPGIGCNPTMLGRQGGWLTETAHQASELNLTDFIKRHEKTKQHLRAMLARTHS
jgi:hypothetical protein